MQDKWHALAEIFSHTLGYLVSSKYIHHLILLHVFSKIKKAFFSINSTDKVRLEKKYQHLDDIKSPKHNMHELAEWNAKI